MNTQSFEIDFVQHFKTRHRNTTPKPRTQTGHNRQEILVIPPQGMKNIQ